MLSFRQPAERVILAGIAAALLMLGVPQTAESLLRLAGGLDSEAAGILPDQMRPLMSHRAAQLESLDEEFGDPQARLNAGLLRLRLAVRTDAPLDRDMARAAIDDLRQGLARAPAAPLAWTALAHAELALADRAAARKALGLSLATAPYDPALTLSRCLVGLALWDDLSEDERQQIRPQVAEAWSAQPAGLLDLAHIGAQGALIASILEGSGQRELFEQALSAR